MRRRGEKKKTSDYPLFSFRLSLEERVELKKKIAAVQRHKNKGLDSEIDKKWLMNDVIIEALHIGLDKLKK